MLPLLKKILFLLISHSLIGFCLRLFILVVLIFLILPKYYESFKIIYVKAEVLLLATVILEIIIDRIGSYYKLNPQSSLNSKDIDLAKINNINKLKALKSLLKGKKLEIFFTTDNTIKSLGDIFLDNNYFCIENGQFEEIGVQIYDNFKNTVVGFDLNLFVDLINHPEYSKLTIEIIKSNPIVNCFNVSFLLSVTDFINGQMNEALYRNFYFCYQQLSKYLKSKFNINFLIDHVGQMEGFKEFFAHHIKRDEILGMSFLANLQEIDTVLQKFIKINRIFYWNLRLKYHQNYKENTTDLQSTYIFIQQLKYIEEYIMKLLNCLAFSKKRFLRNNYRKLITISYIDSKNEDSLLLPIIPSSLKDYLG